MTTEIKLPEGAPEEVVTNALVRDVDLAPFGHKGTLALITLDNGLDHTRPNTFGPQSLAALDAAISDAVGRSPVAIAITGKPFIFAAGADLSALSFLSQREQSLAIGKLGHDVFRSRCGARHRHHRKVCVTNQSIPCNTTATVPHSHHGLYPLAVRPQTMV